ncbi:hypothetical protein F4775DRAFT_594899 [Biscogniauxia sp. FL1348]|nr:hypothetical protein F4775DRAFT_594899 [Biscogniauxia sp. FL1348]
MSGHRLTDDIRVNAGVGADVVDVMVVGVVVIVIHIHVLLLTYVVGRSESLKALTLLGLVMF